MYFDRSDIDGVEFHFLPIKAHIPTYPWNEAVWLSWLSPFSTLVTRISQVILAQVPKNICCYPAVSYVFCLLGKTVTTLRILSSSTSCKVPKRVSISICYSNRETARSSNKCHLTSCSHDLRHAIPISVPNALLRLKKCDSLPHPAPQSPPPPLQCGPPKEAIIPPSKSTHSENMTVASRSPLKPFPSGPTHPKQLHAATHLQAQYLSAVLAPYLRSTQAHAPTPPQPRPPPDIQSSSMVLPFTTHNQPVVKSSRIYKVTIWNPFFLSYSLVSSLLSTVSSLALSPLTGPL